MESLARLHRLAQAMVLDGVMDGRGGEARNDSLSPAAQNHRSHARRYGRSMSFKHFFPGFCLMELSPARKLL
jgi:hypothetical protein